MNDLETLRQLKVLLRAKQFVLTGSFVAHKLGLCDNYSDIDIILVSPEPETLKTLKELEEKFPKNNFVNNYPDNGRIYKFTYNELKIDVFIIDKEFDEKLTYAEFIISPVRDIVKAKKSYKSAKQMLQLIRWRNAIVSDSEIKAFINE